MAKTSDLWPADREWAEFNVPLDTQHVISEMFFQAVNCTANDDQTQPTEHTQ